ncbi:MAG: aryl-sulfate sulfotransferase [Candidatus Heimdallarchaeaceae archaeon]
MKVKYLHQSLTVILLCILIVQFILPSQALFITILDSGQENSKSIMKEHRSNEIVVQDSAIKQSVLQTTDMNIYSTSQQFEGYNLFILNRYDGSGVYNILMEIVDMEGNIFAEKNLGDYSSVAYLPAEFINSTTILYGTRDGARLWNFYSGKDVLLGFKGHHEYEYNSNNNTFFSFERYKRTISGSDYYFDYIREYNVTGGIIWELDTYNFIDETQWCPFGDTIYSSPDVTHSNTIFYDNDEDLIYYNSRNTNTFYKINHSTSEIIWGLGEHGDFTLFNKQGQQRFNLFYHAHAVEKVDDNTFIIFDNDYHNQTNPSNSKSRILEITINENTMTANETFSWEGSSQYYSYYWGDADRLPNGNRFGTFCTFDHGSYTSIGARLVEVNSSSQRVWEMNFPNTGNYQYGIYRAERFGFSPFVNNTSPERFFSNQDIILSWNLWYNFRSKRTITGSYDFYLDNVLIENGTVDFDKFWRTVNLSLDLGKLPDGMYNATLVVYDEADHPTVDTFFVNIGPYFLKRTGPEQYETNNPDSFLTWSGFTSVPLTFNLTINDTNFLTETWNGDDITFDLSQLALGTYNFTVELFNSTTLLFNESFIVEIFPNESPLILSSPPVTQTITWNNVSFISLIWEIFDYSPKNWSVQIDDILVKTALWTTNYFIVNYTLPELDEGSYVVTLTIFDKTRLKATSTINISIVPPPIPIISKLPSNTKIVWNTSDMSFSWEVHGGDSWKIKKNGSTIASGLKEENIIVLNIANWYDGTWLLGEHNLTLLVFYNDTNFVSASVIIRVTFSLSDPYADEYILFATMYCTEPNNAIGAPDGLYSTIVEDYSNGYITLDMGEDEEILDGTGDDFTVIAHGGEYSVWISNDLSKPPFLLGRASENQSFDLAGSGMSKVRYVRVEYFSGAYIELDAIFATNYNTLNQDNEKPSIQHLQDFELYENQTPIVLTWVLFDRTPLNYSLYINGRLFESGQWNGKDISISYTPETLGSTLFALILFDLFENRAWDSVLVTVSPIPETSTPTEASISSLLILTSLILFTTILKKKKLIKQRNN